MRKWFRWLISLDKVHHLNLLLIFAMLIVPATVSATPLVPTKVHPLLLHLSSQHPQATLTVIIQKATTDSSIEQEVKRLGGIVVRDLHIINAFTAQIPAQALDALATTSGVRYLSPDGPMLSASALQAASPTERYNMIAAATMNTTDTTVDHFVRDEFNTVSFANDNGSQPWVTAWQENDSQKDGEGPWAGQVRVYDGALRLDDYPDTGGYPSAARTVDLSDMATTATLRFDFWTDWGVDWNDAVAIEIASDGVHFTVLETITGITGMANGVREYDITAFASNLTSIRFRVANYYGGSSEHFYVDNVEIRYDTEVSLAPPPANPTGDPIFTTWAAEVGDVNLAVKDMNQAPIAAGHTIWFNSVLQPSNINGRAVKLWFEHGRIQFTVNGEDFDLELPHAAITFSPTASVSTTSFDATTNSWLTTVPASYNNETFLSGLAFPVPVALPKEIKDVRWTGRFYTDTPDVKIKWKWAAAVYTNFSADHSTLNVKPVKKQDAPSYYSNDNLAGTPEAFKPYLIKGATGGGNTNYTGDYSSWTDVAFGFNQIDGLLNHIGPDNLFSHGSTVEESLDGFAAEFTPGYSIEQVELLLRTYVPQQLSNDVKVTLWLDDDHKTYTIKHDYFDPHIGAAQAGVITIDVTDAFAWDWRDVSRVTLEIDQAGIKSHEPVYYDAVGLRVSTMPGQVDEAFQLPEPKPGEPIDTSRLINVYNHVVGATTLWNETPAYLQGQGVTVAVVDSGIGKNKDLNLQRIKDVNFNRDYHDSNDKYGHGTFVAGIVAGNGKHSKGEAIGIAPKANLLNVRVSNDQGSSTESEIIEALHWIVLNAEAYNIRVVNLSLNSAVAQSYHTSPLAAAVEILWFNGIVVVVSAGNNGTAELYPPANDPFVITVGATDDNATVDKADDLIGSFSAYGTTETGQVKPELVAPGRNMVAYVPSNQKLTMGKRHGKNSIDNNYFRMTGTSMAAPVVTGAVALLLQDEPQLTPDQVKYRLMATADKSWPGYDPARAGAGYLDIYAAVHGSTTASANTGLTASQLLWSGPEAVTWGSVSWNSVSWNSVSWNSVSWNSVSWNSVSWNSDYWDEDVVVASSSATPYLIHSETTPVDPASRPEHTDLNGDGQDMEQSHKLFLPVVTR